MNASMQNRVLGRVAQLSPFDIKLPGVRTPSPRVIGDGVSRENLRGAAPSEAEYGCVEWYQYRGSQSAP